MTASGEYTAEQIEMVKQQATIITDRSIKKKTPATPTRQDLSPCNPLIGWKTGNTTLPKDWKIKRHEYANQTVYFYMSPKGDIIKSRRAVLEYMFDDEEGGYSEKDFLTVISGAKQRKVALQELYDAKLNRKTIKKKRRRKSAVREDSDEEQDEGEYVSDEELDNDAEQEQEEDDNDNDDEARKLAKKQRVEKEPILPTRRSGRIKEKKKEVGSDNDGSDSDGEFTSPPAKRKCLDVDQDNQVVPVVSTSTPGTEVKRKRGRPPKNQATPQSFCNIQTGEVSEGRVDEKLSGSFVKLDLLKVDLNNDNEIKDFPGLRKLSETKPEITPEPDTTTIKQEDSIHPEHNACEDSKVSVEDFFVTRTDYDVSTNLVKDEVCNGNNAELVDSFNDSSECPRSSSAYDVVVDVLHDLVSNISE